MHPLKTVFVAVLLLPALAAAKTAFDNNSLGGNKSIPNKLIESVMKPDMAARFLSTPYTGFYQIQGKVRNNKLKFEKIKSKASFPDGSLEPLALGLANSELGKRDGSQAYFFELAM